nr:CRISPR-associated endonuclease Cas2 [Mitsuokella multacida]
MKYLICYDIAEQRIRQRVVKLLERRAHRLQYSVFVGDFKECEYKALREQLLEITADSERRLLLIVPMCAVCEAKTWMAGRPMEESNLSCLIV